MVRAIEPTGRLGILPLDGPAADARLRALDEAARYGSIHVALPDGAVLSRGWAIAAVSTWLPRLHWIGWAAAHVPGVARALNAAYDAFAPRRGALARFVPDVEPIERPGDA